MSPLEIERHVSTTRNERPTADLRTPVAQTNRSCPQNLPTPSRPQPAYPLLPSRDEIVGDTSTFGHPPSAPRQSAYVCQRSGAVALAADVVRDRGDLTEALRSNKQDSVFGNGQSGRPRGHTLCRGGAVDSLRVLDDVSVRHMRRGVLDHRTESQWGDRSSFVASTRWNSRRERLRPCCWCSHVTVAGCCAAGSEGQR
jgi:hypothetical protein